MSTISSRTPEGEPIRCPVCGHVFPAAPSKPLMDTTCPNCGCLLIVGREDGWLNVIGVVNSVTREKGRTPEFAPEREPGPPVDDDVSIVPGDAVRLVHHLFAGYVGTVASVDVATGEAIVEISIFSRMTPVKVSLADLVREL